MPEPRRILVTSALPYANGPLHLGYILEAIQTDIFARFLRAHGHRVYYVCADDAHGTPIMLHAERRGIPPEELIAEMNAAHCRDLAAFNIAIDHYSSTHSTANRELIDALYARLAAAGHIARRTIEQFYDTARGIFLPDRFIKGTCPRCAAADQYGDSCEVCGATYAPTDLIAPYSVVSGSTPELRHSEHYFFRLADFSSRLASWIASDALQPEVRNKLAEWFDAGLKDWDISRDAPYFGFRIPGTEDKYFYVWMDAPLGYLAAFSEYCATAGLDFAAFWDADQATGSEVYHFIGKDIIYFHALFWPAMLTAGGYRLPSAVYAHGFLTINGEKMSKSRGTFIEAERYLEHLPADYLRYYFAAKLGDGLADIDLNLDDFRLRVNADLVGKLINIASRSAGFISRYFAGELAAALPDPDAYRRFTAHGEEISGHYAARRYAQAVRCIMQLADEVNRYFDEAKPWVLARSPAARREVQAICTQTLNYFRALITWLAPVVPDIATASGRFLDVTIGPWADLERPLTGRRINDYSPLARRLEAAEVAALLPDSTAGAAEGQAPRPEEKTMNSNDSHPAPAAGGSTEPITIAEFGRLDLRVARIVEAEAVEGADKLLGLTLDLGDRQCRVFAGIKQHYDPEALRGRLTVMVANLAPRKMRFGVSEGMVLAASDERGGPFLLAPDSGAQPGMRVR